VLADVKSTISERVAPALKSGRKRDAFKDFFLGAPRAVLQLQSDKEIIPKLNRDIDNVVERFHVRNASTVGSNWAVLTMRRSLL
jgi:hypothetical protein